MFVVIGVFCVVVLIVVAYLLDEDDGAAESGEEGEKPKGGDLNG